MTKDGSTKLPLAVLERRDTRAWSLQVRALRPPDGTTLKELASQVLSSHLGPVEVTTACEMPGAIRIELLHPALYGPDELEGAVLTVLSAWLSRVLSPADLLVVDETHGAPLFLDRP